ncbi:MAG: acetylglutamate kinase [Candidatus Scalindua sp.]|nr:acetylglutamate kinase [Candidatus Scalindua sp.]MBT5305960.1 acetylglutamate kinase [Candidatus Scalindua sp.]MBT6225975.1 acetylglutamate kinase [Candidatus Scalindua sp.]MBT6564397.1 acetylglutamate kinase [Candidatus Scalindua sp.]MBT7212291.1 acetylglutamate kinase [Candidatus Scalindua sp.]
MIGTKGISMEEAIGKSRVLIEALPYIQSFKDKVVVVKFGGSAMVDKGTFQSVLQDMVFMKSIGMKPVIVHGGGPFISSEMEKRGKKPLFVNGYRVTDRETLEIAIDVLTNQIGKLIIDQINEMGAKGVCVWEGDDSPIKARKLVSKGDGGSEAEDLGYVGELTEIECDSFINLFEEDQIPIVSPIAKGVDGENYNVNADNVASFVAGALKAEKLVFISNTHGISTDPSNPESFTSTLHEDEVNKLIKSGVISGGMLPKANACISAMREGVKKAHIIDGHIPHSLLLEIFTDKGIGTQIIV